jgi:hypothetical protein
MTPIAEALKPYTLYLIYAQIFLLSLAIFIGALLILRRLWRREPVEGALIQDREKLASEIHEEILRMQDLRNRLDPSYILEGKDISASPIRRMVSEPEDADVEGPKVADSNKVVGSPELSHEDVEAKIQAATVDLTNEIAELTAKLRDAEAMPQSAPSAETPPPEDQQKMIAEIQALREKLEDYQAFEDEIALVKQYKAEIDRLKALLEAGEKAKASKEENISISEDDIASLFAEMGASSNESPAEAEPEPTPAEPEPNAPAQVEAEQLEPEREALALSEEVVPIDYVEEARAEEPVLPEISEDTAEAIAELGDDDDGLMAEFEKVLNTKDQEKNT